MDRAKPSPQLAWQTGKDNAHVLVADVMDSVSTRGRNCELDAMKHVGTEARY